MLVIRLIVCTFSIISLFMAGRIRKNYEPQRRTPIEKVGITVGILGVMTFGSLLLYEGLVLYVIPKVLLLASICNYVYFKRKKKCCVPFWKNARITMITFIVCIGVGIVKWVIANFEKAGTPLETASVALLVISCIVVSVVSVILINKVFGSILNRRRVSSFYY